MIRGGIVLLLLAGTAVAGESERVLLPVHTSDIQGAYGSVWRSILLVRNNATSDVFYEPVTCVDTGTCPGGPYSIGPGATIAPLTQRGTGTEPGILFYVTREDSGDIAFQLRIQDISRQALTWGTEIPVVRENEFSTTSVHLLGVPTDNRFRQALRIYNPDRTTPSAVRVVIRAAENQTLVDEGWSLISPEDEGALPFRPGYAQETWLAARYPQITAFETVDIEIIPVTEGLRVWAFVSVTNNETQHVTAVTPQ